MRISGTAPKNHDQSERKNKPIRLVIICAVIALLLVSTSVGMSYARFRGVVGDSKKVYFSENEFVHGKNAVVSYINKDDPNADTVLSYDGGKIVVSVPRVLSAEDTCVAYALAVSEYRPAAYDAEKGAYVLSAKMRLYGLALSSDDSLVTTDVASEDSRYITLRMTTEATMNSADSNQDEWNLTAASGAVLFSEVGSIGTQSQDVDVTVSYNKSNWDGSADTSWYNAASTEFDLDSAAQLAGLAKLVNEGKDFAGVTINLTRDIDLYGTGGEGDVREWTPIGTTDHPFKGNFNGNGHSITGLTLSGGIEADNVGLFGVVEGDQNSFIKDFILVNPTVYGKENQLTGTVVGKATGYKLSGIETSGLTISSADGAVIGTLAGQANGEFSHSECTVDSDAYDFVGETNGSVEAPTEAPTQKPTRSYELPLL